MRLGFIASVLSLLLVLPAAPGAEAPSTETFREWIQAMKDELRGPFDRLRWFCNDGTVHPPKPYPCAERDGGFQHGEWNARTRTLRENGYKVANLLAGIDPDAMIVAPDFADSYAQLIVERFLVAADNGWILRRALFYRGAIQEEDERYGARALLLALVAQPDWIGPRYAALRVGIRLLPHGAETASVQRIRQESSALSDQDPHFIPLRTRIHGAPGAGDALRVRDYARRVDDPELQARYLRLADDIDGVYQAAPLPVLLERNAAIFSRGPWLQELLRRAAAEFKESPSAAGHYRVTARLLADLRDALPRVNQPAARLRVLDLSLAIETENFRYGTELGKDLPAATRGERLEWLGAAIDAAYGTGLVNDRERTALKESLDKLRAIPLSLQTYREELNYLARMPGWATQALRFSFGEAAEKLAQIEPMASVFIQDQLRGSALLFYSGVLDTLLLDASRLAGVRHRLFGQETAAGIRALNPGLACGVLLARTDIEHPEDVRADGIYLLAETVSDLPPVAGILTAGEGNPLSHIQLLARNLGIPNVGVDEALFPALRTHEGEEVVLAVSPAGLVELSDYDERRASLFAESGATSAGITIRPDLDRLDLSVRRFVTLDELRASDSGRIVGPKAAKLGEMRHHFPDAVSPGIAIPFGMFREAVLDRPYGESGQTVFDWMVAQYRQMQSLPPGSPQQRQFTEQFRTRLYDLILHTQPDPAFRRGLHAAMQSAFGADGTYGVFVRSDTNVEDLPGFTGAGLNLTRPNVVGFDKVLRAISEVWASPFTARALAWRQSHMEQPEHVYPAVLLQQSVPAEKSGVMVTTNIDDGDRAVLSVAVNEGVGGAVEGQAAESLRIDTRDGSVRVLATATAPWRRVLDSAGGLERLPASGSDTVLQPDEIARLIRFSQELPRRFPAIVDDAGEPAPADVEFAFVGGRLWLLQLRPFVESRKARGSAYLARMDRALQDTGHEIVDLREVPPQ
jgi:hypothetical protein